MAKEVTNFDKKSRRLRKRIALALPARVFAREHGNRQWVEMTRLVDVSPFGARLRLSRPIDIGRLLQLTLKMPLPLRVFDFAEDQYRVWAIVRNVRLLEQKTPKDSLVEVGVAFIGRRPPRSYDQDPSKRYEIAQTKLESELWSAREESVDQLAEVSVGEKRKESRQLIPVEILIEVFEDDKIVMSEQSVTENISPKGAAVFTALDLEPGTFVKVTSAWQKTTVLGVVRRRRPGDDGIMRLHLEFVGGEWPL